MIKEEQLAAYKEMAKNASANGMEAQIKANLEETCEKFAGNEDKFDRCMAFLKEVCLEMLGGEDAAEGDENRSYRTLSGDIPDEVCFRICRDYFNDEVWKKEDKEAAQAKAEADERAAKNEAKKAELARKKAEAAAIKKAEEERKAAELKKMQEDAEREARAAEESKKAEGTAKAETCPGQLDFLAMMGA